MPALILDASDRSEDCKLIPGQASRTIRIEHEVQGRWTPPNDPGKEFAGSPMDGANEILLVQGWDDLQIRVRENLLEKVVETVESALNQLPQAVTGEIAQAILAFAQQLERLVRDEFRELYVHWSCDFTSPPGCDVAVLHAVDYRSTIHSSFNPTGGAGGPRRMDWTVDSWLFLNERPLAAARIHKAGSGSETDTQERVALAKTRGQDTLRAISKIRLDSRGFYTELDQLVQSLMNIADEASKLSETLDAYMVEWVREQIDWYYDFLQALLPHAALRPSEETQAAERARKKEELERRIRDSVRRLVDEFRRIFRDLLTQWHGAIQLDVSRYTVSCLSEAGKRRLTEYLLQQASEQSDQEADGLQELKQSLLQPGAARAGLRSGEAALPRALWDSVGLAGEDFVVAIVPRAEKAVLEAKIAKAMETGEAPAAKPKKPLEKG